MPQQSNVKSERLASTWRFSCFFGIVSMLSMSQHVVHAFTTPSSTTFTLYQTKLQGRVPASFAQSSVNHFSFSSSRRRHARYTEHLTTSTTDDEGSRSSKRERYLKGPFRQAVQKFKARPGTYLLIPFVAALVGWFTNWLAVQMIFYPIQFRGIPIYQVPEVPLGVIGWQGIVPCKTRTMSTAMVEMVTTQLLSVKEVVQRLDPRKVAELLSPEVPKMGHDIVDGLFPKPMIAVGTKAFCVWPGNLIFAKMTRKFLHDFTVAMQDNIAHLWNVQNCVIDQMMKDRALLGELFRKCGEKELEFLTNSGLWFGFLLGLIQLVVALFWENPWSLSIGGAIVGLATNWLALKWIFEPVNPTRFGPFVLQGQFLRRQKEVSAEFSKFFAENVLTSEKMWNSMLTDPTTTPAFHQLFTQHVMKFGSGVATWLRIMPTPEAMRIAASRAIAKLPDHVGVLHSYVDSKLALRQTLQTSMERMSSLQFERVLHPIFEEDELTLILAGAALGFAAGLVQQGLETGKIKVPTPKKIWIQFRAMLKRTRSFFFDQKREN